MAKHSKSVIKMHEKQFFFLQNDGYINNNVYIC